MTHNQIIAWTEQQVETLKRLHAEEKTYSQIAAELGDGCTRCAVGGKIKRLGLPPSMTPRGTPRGGEKWNDALDATVIQLFDAGRSLNEIGAEIGRSRYSVTHRASKLGLSRKPITGPRPMRSRLVAPRPRKLISYGSTLFINSVSGQCKWPCWEDDTPIERRMICGGEALEGHSYCLAHCRVAFNNFGQIQRMPHVGSVA